MAAKDSGDVVSTKVVIIGAGLAGTALANELASDKKFSVAMLEKGDRPEPIDDNPIRQGAPTNLNFTRGQGLGGTTNYWHSGFMRMPKHVNWYAHLFPDDTYFKKTAAYLGIKTKYLENTNNTQNIFYPFRRLRLKPKSQVTVFTNVVDFEVDQTQKVVSFQTGDHELNIQYDALIIAAGGLASPDIIQRKFAVSSEQQKLLGKNLTDHISTSSFVVKLARWRFQKFSTLSVRGIRRAGHLVKDTALGLDHVFFPRPCYRFSVTAHSQSLKRDLISIHAKKNKLAAIGQLLLNFDLLLELVVNKLPLYVPVRYIKFSIVSEQRPQNSNSVWNESPNKQNIFWSISADEKQSLKNAVAKFLNQGSDDIVDSLFLAPEENNYTACCHHSGTVPIAVDGASGVLDSDLALIGNPDIYVCDGSIMPSTSVANTGFSILELAFRLKDHLSKKY